MASRKSGAWARKRSTPQPFAYGRAPREAPPMTVRFECPRCGKGHALRDCLTPAQGAQGVRNVARGE